MPNMSESAETVGLRAATHVHTPSASAAAAAAIARSPFLTTPPETRFYCHLQLPSGGYFTQVFTDTDVLAATASSESGESGGGGDTSNTNTYLSGVDLSSITFGTLKKHFLSLI